MQTAQAAPLASIGIDIRKDSPTSRLASSANPKPALRGGRRLRRLLRPPISIGAPLPSDPQPPGGTEKFL